ncbi:THUMP domain-containing protein [Thermococcus atlanticus]
MTLLLVTVPTGREGDASLELEWALGEVLIRRTEWKGVLIVETPLLREEALRRIEEFETQSIFRVIPIDEFVRSEENEIIERAFEIAVARIKPGESFAVRCRRRGSRIKSCRRVEVELGARIKAETGAVVDLGSPVWYVLVEVLGRKAGIGVVRAEELVKKAVEE